MIAAIKMIESAAAIILAVLFLILLGDRLDRSFWVKSVAFGLAFGITGMISLALPVEFAPGYLTDGRNVSVALSGALGGPVSAVVTAAMFSAMRIPMGGAGLFVALFSVWTIAAGSSALWAWLRFTENRQPTLRYVLVLATMTALLPPVGLLLQATPPSREIFITFLTLSVPTNFVGVLVLSLLIINDRQRRWVLSAYSESQAQLHAIANNAPGLLFQFFIDPDGIRVSYVSGGAERILGVTAEEIVANRGTVARMVSRKAFAEVERLLKLSAETGQAWSTEAELTKPNGEKVWIRAAGAPRIDIHGKLVWDGSFFDITERKRSEQMKNDFISTVSHELRTPLTSIHGSLGLLAAGAVGEIPPKAAGLIKIAHSNSARLVRLINDVLDIEKIEFGRMPFEPQPMAIRPLIEQSIEGSRGYLADRNVSVVLDDRAPGAMASVDPDRLHQVAFNLLSNAIKYSPKDAKVTVRLTRQGSMVRISVVDRGPGIPEAFRSRIFGKFEQADSSDTRQKGGTGLGLSIVKAIVDKLGGSVSFDTGPDSGTAFHVDLPEVQGDDASSTQHAAPQARG